MAIIDYFSYLSIDWLNVWLSHAIGTRYLDTINGCVFVDHGARGAVKLEGW